MIHPLSRYSDHTIIEMMKNLTYSQRYCNGLFRLGLAVALHETEYFTSDLYLKHKNAHGHKYSIKRVGGKSDDGIHQNFVSLHDSWYSFKYILETSDYYEPTHRLVGQFKYTIERYAAVSIISTGDLIISREKEIVNAMHSTYCAPGGVAWMGGVNARLDEVHEIFKVV